MKRLLCRFHGEQRGAVLVLTSLALIALVVMVALVIDGGYAYVQRRRMQNAADAAAMAGACRRALGGNDAQVESAVTQYATANGATGVSWTYPTGQKIQVTASCAFPTFFAGIVGLPQMTASATAEASLDYLSRAGNLLPMAVKVANFVVEQTYQLWEDNPEAPGNYGWVDWDGVPVGDQELAYNILHPGNSGLWEIGDLIPGAPGVKEGSGVEEALTTWIGQHVTIPFYDLVTGTGANSRYRVAGFGEFVLHGYDFGGSDKYVVGHFIRWVEQGPGGGPNRGLASVRLTA